MVLLKACILLRVFGYMSAYYAIDQLGRFNLYLWCQGVLHVCMPIQMLHDLLAVLWLIASNTA